MPAVVPFRQTTRQRRRVEPFGVNNRMKPSGSSNLASSTMRAPLSEISVSEHRTVEPFSSMTIQAS
jgi:hypothetical protein